MSTVSEQVAEHIGTGNPAFLMKGFPASTPENIPTGKVAVHVYRTGLRKTSANVITHSLTIRVMVPGQDPKRAEELLDAALEAVLKSVETFAGLRWSEGERFSLEDKFHAYDITAEADAINHYRPTHPTS